MEIQGELEWARGGRPTRGPRRPCRAGAGGHPWSVTGEAS